MRKIATLKTSAEFGSYIKSLNIDLPYDEKVDSAPNSPLAALYILGDRTIGNRFAILPMEGWDSTSDGRPTELTKRRWQRFGLSGAKLIFGGEAVAVRPDARSSTNQLIISDENVGDIAKLRELLVQTHEEYFGDSNDLMVGLQLTHSGRIIRQCDMHFRERKVLYHHPILDQKQGVTADTPIMTDDEIARLVEDFTKAAVLAQLAGYDFVDIKHCHGYLGHEFLSAVDRPGRYGGSFDNRTRFLREVVSSIRAEAPGLDIAVRLSAFDFLPFRRGEDGVGEPVPFNGDSYPYAFGSDRTGLDIDLTEPLAFMDLLLSLDIKLVCISAGGGHNIHISSPSSTVFFDTYLPPEDPLIGVNRLISVTAELKRQQPELVYIGSGYSYLQHWLPNVAQFVIRNGFADFVGIGKMALCYPDIVADVLSGRPLKHRLICRTCGYCGAAARHGIPSGCYPLDDFYHSRPEYQQLISLSRKK